MELVSLITPCYNSARFIHRLLDSILIQTYSRLEIIMVDDGSTDNTVGVIESYRMRLEQKGCTLTVLKQPNSGQSVAVNNALKLVSGKYLLWPDSDDYYATEHSIETMADRLERAGDNVGMVRVYCNIVTDDTLENIGYYRYDTNKEVVCNLFEDCLYARNFWFCPIASIIRVSDIDRLLKGREIYTEKRAGQNWQLMLPILYNYQCAVIPELLVSITARQESHSRGQFAGYEKSILKYTSYENTILETLKSMEFKSDAQKEYYINRIRLKYAFIKLRLSYKYAEKDDFKKYYAHFMSVADPKADRQQILKAKYKYRLFLLFKRKRRTNDTLLL